MYGAIVQQILATTDINSMARLVHEAVHLSATQERDVLEITKHYDALMLTEANLHEEIITGLNGRFAERSAQIASVHKAIELWMGIGEHQMAKEVMMHLMDLIKESPSDKAIQQRNSFYRR